MDGSDGVGAGRFDVQNGKLGCGECVVNEFVAFLTFLAVVAGVVKFDRENGLHGGGVAQQKVDVLATYFIFIRAAVVSSRHVQNVPKPHLVVDRVIRTDRLSKNVIKRQLGR